MNILKGVVATPLVSLLIEHICCSNYLMAGGGSRGARLAVSKFGRLPSRPNVTIHSLTRLLNSLLSSSWSGQMGESFEALQRDQALVRTSLTILIINLYNSFRRKYSFTEAHFCPLRILSTYYVHTSSMYS